MFKTTSDNLQHAARNQALNSRKQTLADFERQEIDIASERQALVAEKIALQARISRIKKDQKFSTVNHHAQNKWAGDRVKVLARIAEIDGRLRALRVERLKAAQDQINNPLAFVEAFFRVAKVTLPQEILDRLTTAAIAMINHEEREGTP